MADKKDYTRVGEPVSTHFNTQNELAVIVKRPMNAEVAPGALLLCLVDNEQSNDYAPMLLDAGTAEWIARVFKEHSNG